MKNVLLYFYLVSLLLFTAKLDSFAQIKKSYSKIDFFKDQKNLTLGYKFLSRKDATGYDFIPKLSYDKKGSGMCEIICLPENLNAWQGKILKVKDSLKLLRKWGQDSKVIHPLIMKIATDPSIQKRHAIYAFYTPEEDVALESDLQKRVRRPRLPSFVYVFKKDGGNWLLLKKVLVKDWRSFVDLEFDTVISKQSH